MHEHDDEFIVCSAPFGVFSLLGQLLQIQRQVLQKLTNLISGSFLQIILLP